MSFWRNPLIIKATLFFFVVMLLFNPVYAQSATPTNIQPIFDTENAAIPIGYVGQEEMQEFVWELESKGYVVKEGTLAELDQLTEGSTEGSAERPQEAVVPDGKQTDENIEDKCKQEKGNKAAGEDVDKNSVKQEATEGSESIDPGQHEKKLKDKKCPEENSNPEVTQETNQDTNQDTVGTPEPDLAPVPPPERYPPPAPRIGIGVQGNVGYSSGGHDSDFAKVFFIFAGFVVVAAFIVYAGKYIADIVSGKNVKMWREVILNTTFLSTDRGRHGQFTGAKLATGFVSDELIQLALVGEVGNTSLDLVLNEFSDPTPLDLTATYWMLGASARLHLTDKLVNASYLYLEFLGGTTSDRKTDTIGAARFGASFGINDYLRLGASFGAQYIGLDEDQGFANDGDNYWVTYGLEIGARF